MSGGPFYVLVCQNDKPHPTMGVDPDGPIVHETYLKQATLQHQRQRAAVMERWGACRVARLVFEDHPAFSEPVAAVRPAIDALRQWRSAERDNDAAELANARAARDAVLQAEGGAS